MLEQVAALAWQLLTGPVVMKLVSDSVEELGAEELPVLPAGGRVDPSAGHRVDGPIFRDRSRVVSLVPRPDATRRDGTPLGKRVLQFAVLVAAMAPGRRFPWRRVCQATW